MKSWKETQVSDLISSLKNGVNCGIDHVYDRYLSDFYWFFNYFPNSEFENIFNKKIKIYETSLVDLLINEKRKGLYNAVVEFKIGDMKVEAQKFKGKNLQITEMSLSPLEIGYIYFELREYVKSLNHFLKMIEEEPDNPLYFTNVGLLSLILNDYAGSKKYIEIAIEKGDLFYSYKNLGYLSLIENNMDEALKSFTIAANANGKRTLFREVKKDFDHLSEFISKDHIKKIKENM